MILISLLTNKMLNEMNIYNNVDNPLRCIIYTSIWDNKNIYYAK